MHPYEIQKAKSKINIVDIIQKSGVHLTRAGKDYQALCPFHNEKTASFTVSPAKQIFHCFGCGAGGDVIEFIQRRYNLNFPDALEHLGITQTETQLSKKRIARQTTRQKKQQRRAKREKQTQYEFEAWVLSYGYYLLDWIEAIDTSLPRLTWGQIQELSELIKQRTIWAYHAWIIHTSGDIEAMKSLYMEQTT